MKVCEICGNEISTRDGDNQCYSCDGVPVSTQKKRVKRRKKTDDLLKSFGLTKVKGALGGTYWE